MRELRFAEGGVNLKEEARSIFGYGAVFDKPSHTLFSRDIGEFTETIDKRAFESGLDDGSILILANHNQDLVLGRVGAGTAKIGTDERGLWYEVEPPKSRADIMESVQRRDMYGSSFSFDVGEEDWSKGSKTVLPERRIYSFKKVYDLGPVSFAAYPDTTAAARSFRSYEKSCQENTGQDLRKYKIFFYENSIII